MGFTHVSASHVTGNISLLAVTSFHHDWQNLWLLLISVASFWLGSVLSGMIIGGSELHIKRHYGYAMHLEFVLLCGSLWLYLSGNNYGQMLIAMACGLQNSMVATYHGAVLRTTHLTGLTSDLGATVGHWLVGRKVSLAKVALQSALWWGFFWWWLCGGVALCQIRLLVNVIAHHRHFCLSNQLLSHGKMVSPF